MQHNVSRIKNLYPNSTIQEIVNFLSGPSVNVTNNFLVNLLSSHDLEFLQ